jgi:hypothetical protein
VIRSFLAGLLLMQVFSLRAQTLITTPNPVEVYDTKFTTKDFILRGIDTTLDNFHRYNPVLQWQPMHLALSNLGQAARPLRFVHPKYVGYTHGYHLFDRYFYTSDSVRYYNTKTPFTSARFINGAKEEIVANVIHAQNIGPNVNLGLDYQRLVQDGFYNRNKSGIHNLNLFQWFRSRNNRYNLMAAYLFNQARVQENGGVTAEDIFTNAAFQRDRRTAPVNLANAENKVNNNVISVRQSFFFGPTYERTIHDSLRIKAVKPRYALHHYLQYESYNINYRDDIRDSSFYQNFFISPDSTRDNTKSWSLMNDFSFQKYAAPPDDTAFSSNTPVWKGGMRFILHRWNQLDYSTFRLGLQLHGGLQSNPYSQAKWKYSLNGTLELAPKYAGDFMVDGKLAYSISNKMMLEPFVSLNLQSPAFRWERTRGNHFQWDNDFRKIFLADVGLIWKHTAWNLEAGLQNQWVENYLYLEEDSRPVQLESPLNVLQIHARKDFVWKRFYLGNKASLQWASNDDIIRMPLFFLQQQFYYKGSYIKKKPIRAQFGLDLTYFTNHFADGYNPALISFVLQRETRLSYYPIIDVFFNLQIKRARLFFQMQHVNEGLFGDGGYFISPLYPAAPRAFKLGVSWQFYD